MPTCGASNFRGWITASTVQNILLQIFGSIVNGLSLWCLWKCRRTGNAIKMQLGLVFMLLLLICAIILPAEGWINYKSFYCYDHQSSSATTIFFLISSGFTLQLERMNISTVAVYRFIAVQFPQLYKRMTQVKVVLALEAFMCAYISIPYVMGFTQHPIKVVRFDNGDQYVKFGRKNTTIYGLIYKIYGYNFLVPFLITLTAYSLMIVTILYQKYKSQSIVKRDQVTFTLQFLIFVDLVLEGPHAISHVAKTKKVTLAICHLIFHLHLVVDPLIFLLLNPHNRRTLLQLLHGALPQRVTAYLPPAETTSTNVHPKESLQAMSSPTPGKNRKHFFTREGSENSQMSITPNPNRLEHVFTSSPVAGDEQKQQKKVSENEKPLLTSSTTESKDEGTTLSLDNDTNQNISL